MSYYRNDAFASLLTTYQKQLTDYLNNSSPSTETAKDLGQQALESHINAFSLIAIHYDTFQNYIIKQSIDDYRTVANKAEKFLKTALSSLQINPDDYDDAIHLFDNTSEDVATEIRKKSDVIKEIYHRIKNNLQMMSNLLNVQIDSNKEPVVHEILIESIARVHAMSLTHEMLYQANNTSNINMAEYINNLINYLYQIYDIDHKQIQCEIDVETIILDVDKAIPIGLLINELITNIFKYAYPGNRHGCISILFKRNNNNLILRVKDDGKGIATDININDAHTIGMQLVNSITKQLGGQIELDRSKGSSFTLTIPS